MKTEIKKKFNSKFFLNQILIEKPFYKKKQFSSINFFINILYKKIVN